MVETHFDEKMAVISYPYRARIIGSNAAKYITKPVVVVGEVISMVPAANSITIKTSDDTNIIVLLQKNSSPVELNLLTEVSGKLISLGQMEATHVKQWSAKATALFNHSLYVSAVETFDGFHNYLSI